MVLRDINFVVKIAVLSLYLRLKGRGCRIILMQNAVSFYIFAGETNA